MHWRDLAKLGDPDLQVGSLRVWIHGRQFPDAEDYWDGNWLRVTAWFSSEHAMVRTDGPIIHLGEIVGLLRECESLYQSLKGKASLQCIEPNLRVTLEAEWNGSVKTDVSITPDQLTERHHFHETLDQTYLPGLVTQCKAVLAKFPVREPNATLPNE